MKWAIGVIAAKRPVATIEKTISSIRTSWADDHISACHEPDAFPIRRITQHILAAPVLDCQSQTMRPWRRVEMGFEPSPNGVFGNFQNWIQSVSDILFSDREADTILMCEDDALLTEGIREYVEDRLWPSSKCGVVSLYCPPLRHYQHSRIGIAQTQLQHAGPKMTRAHNLVGALALIFPRAALEQILSMRDSIAAWPGSHAQAADPTTKPWERKAVDTWIGRAILECDLTAWHFTPSLVTHYSPDPKISNSSLGNGQNHGIRQAKTWVRDASILSSIPKPAQTFVIPSRST